MGQVFVADDSGTFRPAKAVWVADDSGTFRAAKDVLVSDDAGTFHGGTLNTYAGGATLGLVLTPSNPTWRYVRASFPSQAGAAKYEILSAGNNTVYGSSTTPLDQVLGPFPPQQNVYFDLKVTKTDGTSQRGATVGTTTGSLPAPANFTQTGINYNSATYAFDAVDGATSYQVLDMVANKVIWEGTANSGVFISPLFQQTYYDLAVRSVYNGIVSGTSSHSIFTTPAQPGPSAGPYEFLANSATTWAPSPGIWKPDSDGLYHGNGAVWGSNWGNQASFFFYGANYFAALRGGRCTRFEVFVNRLDDSGTFAAQTYHWILHPHTGRPSGSPYTGNFPSTDAGALARGTSGWIDLPADWGQTLIDGTWQGIAFGNVTDRYMHSAAHNVDGNNGRIRLTIG